MVGIDQRQAVHDLQMVRIVLRDPLHGELISALGFLVLVDSLEQLGAAQVVAANLRGLDQDNGVLLSGRGVGFAPDELFGAVDHVLDRTRIVLGRHPGTTVQEQ